MSWWVDRLNRWIDGLMGRWVDGLKGSKVHCLTRSGPKARRIFSFLVITHTDYLGFGPDLVGIFPRSLPQLSKQLRDQNHSQKHQKNEIQIFFVYFKGVLWSFTKRYIKNLKCVFLGSCYLMWNFPISPLGGYPLLTGGAGSRLLCTARLPTKGRA